MFIRINRYVVQLSPQELRHAKGVGKFHDFVENLGRDDFWKTHKIFSASNLRRMRSVEFSAELAILLSEGPQDKKSSIDLYYGSYQTKFPEEQKLATRLKGYLSWIVKNIPDLSKTRYRKPVDLYAMIGAIDRIAGESRQLSKITAIGPAQVSHLAIVVLAVAVKNLNVVRLHFPEMMFDSAITIVIERRSSRRRA